MEITNGNGSNQGFIVKDDVVNVSKIKGATWENLRVYELLGEGKENAISRGELSGMTGFSDRALRKLIEELRRMGIQVINDGDGRGYYLANDIDSIYRQYQKDLSYMKNFSQRMKHTRRILKQAGREV
jgi:biotin operon repressor